MAGRLKFEFCELVVVRLARLVESGAKAAPIDDLDPFSGLSTSSDISKESCSSLPATLLVLWDMFMSSPAPSATCCKRSSVVDWKDWLMSSNEALLPPVDD